MLEEARRVAFWRCKIVTKHNTRQRGYTLRCPHDFLVARIEIEQRLLHDNRDFEVIAEVEPRLKLFATDQ